MLFKKKIGSIKIFYGKDGKYHLFKDNLEYRFNYATLSNAEFVAKVLNASLGMGVDHFKTCAKVGK